MIPGLKRAADAVHAHGAKLGIELYVGGRQTPSSMSQRQPIAPSVVPCEVLAPTPVPRELTVPEIKEVVESFAAAARRVVAAGLDMIHLHGAPATSSGRSCRRTATGDRTNTEGPPRIGLAFPSKS